MSFTNGKPCLVTAAELGYSWSGARDGRNFRCHLCGHFFAEGDYFVFVYANAAESPARCGNFLACSGQDGPTHGTKLQMLEAAAEAEAIVREKYWWAMPAQSRPHSPAKDRDRKADRWDS